PHELHDFHVDIKVDDEDLTIMDFTGYIDDSDFHFNGLMHDYGFWMQPEFNGDVDLDVTLSSDLLRLENIFTYQGENYVPEDYRHEELEGFVVHANTSLHFKQSQLHSIDLDLDRLEAKMHLHPLRFERFSGQFHYEDEHLVMTDFQGQMGRTEFEADMDYYLGDDPSVRKRDNYLDLAATYIDLDELTNFNLGPAEAEGAGSNPPAADTISHEDAYNLYDLPFTDMRFLLSVDHFIYHRVDLQKIKAKLRTTQDHYLYVDTLSFRAAGGNFRMNGYFNGSDPDHIYLKPKLQVEHADIDGLLFKFESHGEDEPLSENIHGSLTADIDGNIRIYPDFVPNLDESEIHMDIEVLEGRLVNYSAMELLSDYMGNKDLTNIRFDTLTNHMDMTNGLLTIPNMTIESTIGHFELSGQQDLDFNMEYYLRIPWTLITQGTRNKLFGGRNKDPKVGEDEIVKYDPTRNVRFLNLKIAGNIDDYSVGLGKDGE
ncbi:MAG: AsmA-like C-terminal region-containing protein, partial [Bacteroidota bacterium]